MKIKPNSLSRGTILQYLDYDADTGIFTWKSRDASMFTLTTDAYKAREACRWNTRFAGRTAGKIEGKGYLQTSINGKSYMLHRLAWIIMSGSDAEQQIDHIDGDKTNNRWANLRAATQHQNMWNRGKRKNNSTGFTGVTPKRGKFEAYIDVNGKRNFLGTFTTAEEASSAYKRASISLHGEFSPYARAA